MAMPRQTPIMGNYANQPQMNQPPAKREMRGRIYAANDVLAGVGGNEQLANALKAKSPVMGGVNYEYLSKQGGVGYGSGARN